MNCTNANLMNIAGFLQSRGASSIYKYFGTCYQFSFKKIDSSIFISEIEINV